MSERDKTPEETLETIDRLIGEVVIDPRHLRREEMMLLIIRYLQDNVTQEVRTKSLQFLGMIG